MTPPREPWAILRALLRRVRGRRVAAAAAGAGASAGAIEFAAFARPEVSEPTDSSDLLKRRMQALHLDPDDLDRASARMSGVETGLCARCESRGKCLRDLEDEFADPGWGDWRNYCPNATTLTMLSTLRECEEEPCVAVGAN